ncbi:MAG: hypothetical protein US63_C0002G0003 [Candidatus Moranbacteria bacterium GW2011_GWC2_37_8]|nr:MAG: hypothetical protein US63_C0002G0003 [Candidatus Moranbacteria bacterium GW2011_GWC2_37_8]KKQ62713.1 MAG: hypothetical protein US82_C0007G0003 [Parcubacteria group bacterium GW2011_GWC1_38_22]
MLQNKFRPLLLFVVYPSIFEDLIRDQTLHRKLRERGTIDFGFRRTIEDIDLKSGNVYVIMFLDENAPWDWMRLAKQNIKNEKFCVIHNLGKFKGPNNYRIITPSISIFHFMMAFSRLREAFPVLMRTRGNP